MSSNFEATTDFTKSVEDINVLLHFADEELQKGNEDTRILFLKLSVVSLVTKFQVFIEGILKEYLYKIKTSEKKNVDLNVYMRLNSIKIYTSDKILHKKLENPDTYNFSKLTEVQEIVQIIGTFCKNDAIIDDNFKLETRYPLGRTGLNELIKLFRQINGEDIFQAPPFDVNKLNEILGKRHAIIHEDINPQTTEENIEEYLGYINLIVDYLDNYLYSHL